MNSTYGDPLLAIEGANLRMRAPICAPNPWGPEPRDAEGAAVRTYGTSIARGVVGLTIISILDLAWRVRRVNNFTTYVLEYTPTAPVG